MRDKRDVMRLHIKNGIRDLNGIRESYNTYANGGFTNKFPWEENPNTPENKEAAKRYLEREEERRIAKENEFNNPSTRRLIGEALQLPYRWISNPQRIIGDITGDKINPNSRKDILEDRWNSINGQSNISKAVWELPSAMYNTAAGIAGGPYAASALLSNYMADSNVLEGIGTASAMATGVSRNPFINNISEKQKYSGGITDLKQSLQNAREKDYGNAAINALTGISGIFDTSHLTGPLGTVGKVVDTGIETLNKFADFRDMGKSFGYDIVDAPKDIKDKSVELYNKYKKNKELERQRAELARRNKANDDRRESLERIKRDNIIIPSEENNYRMF